MTNSPDLGIPLVSSPPPAQAEVLHNEAILLLIALQKGATDRAVNTPPVSPSEEDVYILGAAPTGAWSGKANKIAVFIGGAWSFIPGNDSAGSNIAIGARHEGIRLWVNDEDVFYVWSGSAWISNAGTVTSVAAGAGLAGGPITTSGTLTLDDSHANTWTGKQDLTVGGDLTPAATPATNAIGYLGSPQNIQNGAYTTVMGDAGKHIYHTSGSAHTWTIDSNANVAYPIGTILTFINEDSAGIVTLAITSDTLRWGSSTGSRSLAANGTATAIKVASTTWRLTGDGIS